MFVFFQIVNILNTSHDGIIPRQQVTKTNYTFKIIEVKDFIKVDVHLDNS